ncbi:MAG TPA: response regulator [Nitrospiraceae bacterium]|nr:response regulator [Nitrospiraceae bacterium]
MTSPLRILHLEDQAPDSRHIESLLIAEGIPCTILRVDTREAFLQALDGGGLDVILSNVILPSFDGMAALAFARARSPQVPFLFVTDTRGEETAIEALKSGARDYVLKQHLTRLAPSVLRALKEAQERTQRQKAEEALRKIERRLRAITDSEPACVKLVDAQGVLLEINPAGLSMTGAASEHEIIGRPVLDLIHSDDRAAYHDLHARVISGHPGTLQYRLVDRHGRERWMGMRAVPLKDTPDGPMVSLSIARDITEAKRTEEQLHQARKMEAIGRLAGGVAHDFNNVLTGITGHSDLLLRHLPPEAPARRHAQEIKKAGQRCAALTKQLLAFSRKQVLVPKVLDLNAAISGMEEMLRLLIGEDVVLKIRLSPRPLYVQLDPVQIEQVLLNLAVNARDAMPQGGALTIATATVKLSPRALPGQTGNPRGPYVQMIVRDTGCGMDDDTVHRIFEPFFTTKESGKGTGLGLATVHAIIQEGHGYIEVDSTPGQGSTFTVYLPRCPGVDRHATSPAEGESLTERHAKTILLVEDDPVVRQVTSEILTMNGYRVLEAKGGEEAMSLSDRHGGGIDLLLTDVVMPKMSGRDLAEYVAPMHPGLHVVYMSGYADDALLNHGVSGSEADFLPKPFTPDQLEHTIRAILGTPSKRC